MNLKHITTTILLIMAVSLSFNTVYAEEVPMPTLPTDNMVGMDVRTIYASDYRYTVIITVEYQVVNPVEVLESIYWTDMTGQIIQIEVKKDFKIANTPTVTPSLDDDVVNEDPNMTRSKELKEERQMEQDEIWGKYRQCLIEFEEEQPVRFNAWKRTAGLTEFVIPDEKSYIRNHSQEEIKAAKAWQVCETLKAYKWIGAQEANKVLDGIHYNFGLDDYNDPKTPEDFTQDDFDSEAKRAADFQCSEIGKQRGLCNDRISGDLYVKPDPTLPAWYGTYTDQIRADTDLKAALDDALKTQCEVYYPLYTNSAVNDLPVWLEHCEGAK